MKSLCLTKDVSGSARKLFHWQYSSKPEKVSPLLRVLLFTLELSLEQITEVVQKGVLE